MTSTCLFNYQLHVTKIVTPRLLGPAEYRGYKGRSNENDLCFYNRQYLFSTVQVTELISTPLTDICLLVPHIWKSGVQFFSACFARESRFVPHLKIRGAAHGQNNTHFLFTVGH